MPETEETIKARFKMPEILASKHDEYLVWKAKNQRHPYSARCFSYAEEWAFLMEERMAATGQTVAEVAKQASRDADYDGITGFMYGMAVSILAPAWKHGDALRRWHNLDVQIGDEGERANESGGVLNPALLNIKSPS